MVQLLQIEKNGVCVCVCVCVGVCRCVYVLGVWCAWRSDCCRNTLTALCHSQEHPLAELGDPHQEGVERIITNNCPSPSLSLPSVSLPPLPPYAPWQVACSRSRSACCRNTPSQNSAIRTRKVSGGRLRRTTSFGSE